MGLDGVDPVSATTGDSSAESSSSDADLFSSMVEGLLKTGISLGNSIVGDVIETINDDSADPS